MKKTILIAMLTVASVNAFAQEMDQPTPQEKASIMSYFRAGWNKVTTVAASARDLAVKAKDVAVDSFQNYETTTLVCGGGSKGMVLTGGGVGCINPVSRKLYLIVGAGAGTLLGVEGKAGVLVFRHRNGTEISGTWEFGHGRLTVPVFGGVELEYASKQSRLVDFSREGSVAYGLLYANDTLSIPIPIKFGGMIMQVMEVR